MRSTTSEPFPDHLIEQILFKLPPKSLLRFQCLSKTWRDEIGGPSFARTHLQRNRTNSIVVAMRCIWPRQRFILDWNPHHGEVFLERNGCTYNNGYFHVVATSDGVLCIAASDDSREETELVFWNPTTRKQKTLTVPTRRNIAYRFAFGYDSSIDDYKVVKLTMEEPGISIVSIVEVLEMKSGQWRRIYNLPSSWTSLEGLAVSLNGSLYWRSARRNNETIIRFDLGTETFSEVSVPVGVVKMELLRELQGKLCCIARFSSVPLSPTDILVLKDGVWVKVFISDFLSHRACFVGSRSFVVADGWDTLYIDDLNSKNYQSLSIPTNNWWPEVACPQSLVSI